MTIPAGPVADWKLDAACVGSDPRLFFPERGEATRPAKAVCAGCPVAEECLDAGMWEKFGIWGGLSERERRRRRAGTRAARTCEACRCDISDTTLRTRFCDPCMAERRAEQLGRRSVAAGLPVARTGHRHLHLVPCPDPASTAVEQERRHAAAAAALGNAAAQTLPGQTRTPGFRLAASRTTPKPRRRPSRS